MFKTIFACIGVFSLLGWWVYLIACMIDLNERVRKLEEKGK